MAAASAADDGVYPIALDWQTFTGCQPYGFDIGNTLCKLIYRPKEYDQPNNEEEKAAKKWHLRFCKFPLSAIEDMISFIQHNCDLASQTENFMCCGLGSIGFNKRIQEALNIKYAAHQPGEQTVQTLGLTFLASRLALADFTAPHDPSAEEAALSVARGYYGRIPGGCRESRSSDWPENGRVQFPCMVFLGGSGSCCMKISDEGEVSRQEMFWLSGKAFDVMYTLATGAKAGSSSRSPPTEPPIAGATEVTATTAPAEEQVQDAAVLRNLLIELQKLTEVKAGIPHRTVEENGVDMFFEDDIILTKPQAEILLQDVKEETEHRKRKKRKLAEPMAKRWETPVPYIFDGTHNDAEKFRIRQALAYWEDHTCITFVEDTSAQHRLMFSKGRGCWSYVGYTHQVNQIISIGDGCQSNGTIAHEVGHAIGFWHEQSRPDRDLYIAVNKANVSDGKLYNFDKRTWGEIVTLGVPYDLGSDMHYGSKFYARDVNSTLSTVTTRDLRMMRVIGQRQELSFYDVKLANMAYCEAECSVRGINLTEPCQRDGYQDPKACSQCRCPDGFGGQFCERPANPRNAYCGGTLLAAYNGSIYSPGYPLNYRADVSCSWLIKAPAGTHVYLEFDGRFGLVGHEDVCKDYVEVRYNSSLSLTGARFCMEEAPQEPLRSDGNEMLVLFRSYMDSARCDDNKYPWKCKFPRKGFKAKYYIKSCGGCHGNGVMGQMEPACVRRVAFTCAQTWEDKTEIACPSWWYTEGCGTQTVTKTRYATCHRDETYCCNGYTLVGDKCRAPREQQLLFSNIIPTLHASPIQSSDPRAIARSNSERREYSPSPNFMQPGVYNQDQVPSLPQPPSQIWTEWSDWSICSVKCGGGVAVRTRTCTSPGYCGSSNIQADKMPCGQAPCYKTCEVEKRILCDLWTTCTRKVTQLCPYCYTGYELQGSTCLPMGTMV